jgi:predicted peroxiredoxin
MDIGKKVMIMIIGLNLAGTGILGGLVLQISQWKARDQGIKEIVQADEKPGKTRQDTAGLRPPAPDTSRRINKIPLYHMLTTAAAIGGLMIIFFTVLAVVTIHRENREKDPVPDITDYKNKGDSLKQLIEDINDLNKEIDLQTKSISQSTLAIKQMLSDIRLTAKTLPPNNDKTSLNGTQGETFDHIPLPKQI